FCPSFHRSPSQSYAEDSFDISPQNPTTRRKLQSISRFFPIFRFPTNHGINPHDCTNKTLPYRTFPTKIEPCQSRMNLHAPNKKARVQTWYNLQISRKNEQNFGADFPGKNSDL